MARKKMGALRPEDVYRWPDEVQARLGVGRAVYLLVRVGGLRVWTFGNRRLVRGHEVIEALDRIFQSGENLDDENGTVLRTTDAPPRYEVSARVASDEK